MDIQVRSAWRRPKGHTGSCAPCDFNCLRYVQLGGGRKVTPEVAYLGGYAAIGFDFRFITNVVHMRLWRPSCTVSDG